MVSVQNDDILAADRSAVGRSVERFALRDGASAETDEGMVKVGSVVDGSVERFALRDGASATKDGLVKVGVWGNTLVRKRDVWNEVADVNMNYNPGSSAKVNDSAASSFPTAPTTTGFNEMAITKGIESAINLKGGKPLSQKKGVDEEKLCIGGLRNAGDLMSRLSTVRQFGYVFRSKLDDWLQEMPQYEEKCWSLIGLAEDKLEAALAAIEPSFQSLKSRILEFLKVSPPSAPNEFETEIEAENLRAWATAAMDPGAACVDWLDKTGSPAGLEVDFDLHGIWPTADPTAQDDPDADLASDFDGFVNYDGFDNDQECFNELWSFVERGKLKAFKNLEECREYLGAEPLLSRFGVLSRTKNGRTKKRIILDCKQSGLSKKTRREFKIMLPKLTDLVRDSLILAKDLQDNEEISFLILDFCDAFWNIPLDKRERRWFVGRVRGWYLIYCDTAQGSRNGPMSWCTIAALLSRLTQGLFDPRRELRLQIYVDDPAATMRGTLQLRRRFVAIVVTVWRTMGFRLAFSKGKLGKSVQWIGAMITSHPTKTVIGIPGDRAKELIELSNEIEGNNLVSVKTLRTYAGKACSIASLIDVMRPFCNDIYGTIRSVDNPDKPSKAPPNCAWSVQVKPATGWIKAFLSRQRGSICRVFRLNAFLGIGTWVEFYLDASPWGIGGFMTIGGQPQAWFSDGYSKYDIDILDIKIGDCASQQTGECLAVVAAVKTWKSEWMREGCLLAIYADNITALTMIDSFKGGSSAVNTLAREAALEFGDSTHRPAHRKHLPGICNKVADELSRSLQPGVTFRVPELLKNITKTELPTRELSYYIAKA